MELGGCASTQLGGVLSDEIVSLLEVAFVVFFLSNQAAVGGEFLWCVFGRVVLKKREGRVVVNRTKGTFVIFPSSLVFPSPFLSPIHHTHTLHNIHTRLYASWHTTSACRASSMRVCTPRCCPSICACALLRLSSLC